MSDDDYDDELPPITVNSSFTRDSHDLLRMPTAEELALQRAREAECERELQALRASNPDVCLHTTDSSSSEGETAQLAASVNSLQVKSAPVRFTLPKITDLLTPMLSRLPEDYVPVALLESLREATPTTLDVLTQDVCEATAAGQLNSPEEATAMAVWLCAAAVGAGSRDLRRRSRRTLHGLLAQSYFSDPDGAASRALRAAVAGGALDASVYVELADAVAPAPARALHRRLLLAALGSLLGCEVTLEAEDECGCAWAAASVCGAWARLDVAACACAVRVVGRLLRACGSQQRCAAHRQKLLAAFAPANAARTGPDRLEVLVAAQKLQLLFGEK